LICAFVVGRPVSGSMPLDVRKLRSCCAQLQTQLLHREPLIASGLPALADLAGDERALLVRQIRVALQHLRDSRREVRPGALHRELPAAAAPTPSARCNPVNVCVRPVVIRSCAAPCSAWIAARIDGFTPCSPATFWFTRPAVACSRCAACP
jgi:hypothetical protein